MKKLVFITFFIALLFCSVGCQTKTDSKPEIQELNHQVSGEIKTITVVYSDGRKIKFCQKEEGSTTYVPCPPTS